MELNICNRLIIAVRRSNQLLSFEYYFKDINKCLLHPVFLFHIIIQSIFNIAESSKDEGKKTSMKDKVKKKLSMRSINFLRKKPKSKDDGETSKNEEAEADADKTVEEKAEEDKTTEENAVAEEVKVEDAAKTEDVAEETTPETKEKATEEEKPSTTEETEDKPPIEDEKKE